MFKESVLEYCLGSQASVLELTLDSQRNVYNGVLCATEFTQHSALKIGMGRVVGGVQSFQS